MRKTIGIIGERKMMKVVQIGQSKYYIYDKDDEINLVHKLIAQGLSVEEISKILGVSKRKVMNYLEDCWA